MQEDDAQKHLQLEAVEHSSHPAAFPNAEVSANLPCLVSVSASQAEPVATCSNLNMSTVNMNKNRRLFITLQDTHMSVLNVRSFPVKAPSSSGASLHLPTQVPEDGMGVLRATQLPGDAYQWSNCSISYRSPVDTRALLISSSQPNHFYGNQDDIKSMACPPKANSMASEHGDGFNVSAQIGTRNKKQVYVASPKLVLWTWFFFSSFHPIVYLRWSGINQPVKRTASIALVRSPTAWNCKWLSNCFWRNISLGKESTCAQIKIAPGPLASINVCLLFPWAATATALHQDHFVQKLVDAKNAIINMNMKTPWASRKNGYNLACPMHLLLRLFLGMLVG